MSRGGEGGNEREAGITVVTVLGGCSRRIHVASRFETIRMDSGSDGSKGQDLERHRAA